MNVIRKAFLRALVVASFGVASLTLATSGQATDVFVDSGQSIDWLPWHGGVCVGDIDADGDLDVAVGGHPDSGSDGSNRVWRNNGAGVFSSTGQILGVGERTDDCAMGDVDGDGDLDIWFANDEKDFGYGLPDRVWVNDGSGTFTDSGQAIGDHRGKGVRLGDVDGDGDLDGIVANFTGDRDGDVRVYLNDGSGYFTSTGQVLGGGTVWGIDIGDLDGDGDLDIFCVRSGSNLIFLNDGDGVFTDSGQGLGNQHSLGVALGDLDGDGDLDAFVANSGIGSEGAPDKVWVNDGSGTFTDRSQAIGNLASSGVALGDVDRDGDLDALVVSTMSHPERLWVNDGTGLFSSAQDIAVHHARKVALADFDDDGDLDAFVTIWGGGNRMFVNTTPTTDADGDGIENAVDGTFDGQTFVDESANPSDNFTNQHLGGTTSGTIIDRGGFVVTVKEEIGSDGLRFITSGAGGSATVNVCGFTANFPSGIETVISCGSLTAQVITGPIEVLLGMEPVTVVSIPSGATATLTETGSGIFEILNAEDSAASVVVEAGGEMFDVAPGDSRSITAALCGMLPSEGCITSTPGHSRIKIRLKDGDGDRFRWKLNRGGSTALADFRNPIDGSPAIRICLWDATGKLMEMTIPHGGLCAGKPCWKAVGSSGFKYANRSGSPDGITGAKLKAGTAGKTQVQANGRGSSLPSPALPLIPPIAVELLVDDGTAACWQTTFVNVTKNAGEHFAAKGP